MKLAGEPAKRLLDRRARRRRARRRAARSSRGRWSPSVFAVDVFDEAGELVRRRAHRAQRLLVVHAQRAEQADGPERLVRDAVGRADERQVAQARLLELFADARERPARVECAARARRAAPRASRAPPSGCDRRRSPPTRISSSRPGGAADEQLPVLVGRLLERAADHEQERPLAHRRGPARRRRA